MIVILRKEPPMRLFSGFDFHIWQLKFGFGLLLTLIGLWALLPNILCHQERYTVSGVIDSNGYLSSEVTFFPAGKTASAVRRYRYRVTYTFQDRFFSSDQFFSGNAKYQKGDPVSVHVLESGEIPDSAWIGTTCRTLPLGILFLLYGFLQYRYERRMFEKQETH